MLGAKVRQQGAMNQQETSQLLVILSDGRGLFLEGMETVRQAVRQAREANVFVVFVIIDNPENKVRERLLLLYFMYFRYQFPVACSHVFDERLY